ncbi:MAG: twin-arginine translocation signal domain-containing protein [Planctomycetota bacterium]
MRQSQSTKTSEMSRRNFLQAVGGTAASVSLSSNQLLGAAVSPQSTAAQKGYATVQGAFVYPPTESLRKVGYYSWQESRLL